MSRSALVDPADTRHGTINGYCNHDCRCVACRRAWADYTVDLVRRRPALGPGDRRHGTYNGYKNHRCRCDQCKAAHNTYRAGRKARGLRA